MTYVVNDKCIGCKHTACVSVCPVDCFYEGPNTLVIDPSECIDCGVCEPECPELAILSDQNPEADEWIDFNARLAAKWSDHVIFDEKDPLPDYEANRAKTKEERLAMLIEDWDDVAE